MPRSASSLQDLGLLSGGSNLLLRRFAESVRANGERDLELAVTKNLHAVALGADNSRTRKQFRRHCLARRKSIERLHIHNRVRFRERARETTLRQSPMQWHLAAFEARAA